MARAPTDISAVLHDSARCGRELPPPEGVLPATVAQRATPLPNQAVREATHAAKISKDGEYKGSTAQPTAVIVRSPTVTELLGLIAEISRHAPALEALPDDIAQQVKSLGEQHILETVNANLIGAPDIQRGGTVPKERATHAETQLLNILHTLLPTRVVAAVTLDKVSRPTSQQLDTLHFTIYATEIPSLDYPSVVQQLRAKIAPFYYAKFELVTKNYAKYEAVRDWKT